MRLSAAAVLGTLLCTAAACDKVQEPVGRSPTAIQSQALQAAVTDPAVRGFYEKRQWRSAWSDYDGKSLLAALAAAQRHGLDASRYTRLIKSAGDDAARDAALTQTALRFAKMLSSGVVDPKATHAIYTLDVPKVDVAAGLELALQVGNLAQWLDSLPPQDAEYAVLSKAYVGYRAQAEQAKEARIATGPVIAEGSNDPRVPIVAQRLAGSGYLPDSRSPAASVFTRAMADALKSLQREARLPATGRLDEATVRTLNEAPAKRARQLAVNMERRRWLSREVPATRIDVNTVATQLVYYRDGAPAWTSNVVVGDRKHKTPALGGSFKQLVVNPPWRVPRRIAKEEILPKGRRYLARQNMYVENGQVVQRPGPRSALGLVKFDMQNRYAIYLHDTPAKSLFQQPARHRSHGCVRVEKAVEFARFLAAERGKAEAFDTALQGGDTKLVALDAEVPVRLLYHSVYLGSSGQLMFADDPYGWDEKVGQALGLEPARRRPAAVSVSLPGP